MDKRAQQQHEREVPRGKSRAKVSEPDVRTPELSTARCPNCKSIEFRGVGVRNDFEKALLWLIHPCQCDFCGHHFFLLRWQAPIDGTA